MKVRSLCVVLMWRCQACPLNSTEYWSLGTWGPFWTRVMNTAEAVKSANSCMEMQSHSQNCQRVWESPSVHAFALCWGWEQPGSLLLVFNFATFMFQFDKSIWTRLWGRLSTLVFYYDRGLQRPNSFGIFIDSSTVRWWSVWEKVASPNNHTCLSTVTLVNLPNGLVQLVLSWIPFPKPLKWVTGFVHEVREIEFTTGQMSIC